MNCAPDRRAILRMIAAGAAASVAACSRPRQTIYPSVDLVEGAAPGAISRYATSIPLAGYGRGVTGLVIDERPIKLEGLAAHPASLGSTDLFGEVSILDLYDPQRLRMPISPAGPASWTEFATAAFEHLSKGGGESMAILTGRITSPTLLARIAVLKARYPGIRHVRWEPVNDDTSLAGARLAFGRPLTARPRFREADVILTLGADPLGAGPDQIANARYWSARRRTDPMPLLFAIEPSLTLTGAMADRRASAGPAGIAAACRGLAAALRGTDQRSAAKGSLATLLANAVPALLAARGRAVVLAGDGQPADVHAFVAWVNQQLDAPIDWIAPVDPDPRPHGESLAALAADLHAGHVDTLVVIDANPVYAAPPELRFADAMARARLSVVAATVPNETSAAARWQLPLSHALESWGDYRGPDGTASIAQPLVAPLHDGRSAIELIDLLGDPAADRDGYKRLRDTWQTMGEDGWRRALTEGVVPNSAAAPVVAGTASFLLPEIRDAEGMTLERRTSPTLYDGSFSSNAWAQECPEPLTKEVWGSSARMHPRDMGRIGVLDGDLVRIERGHGVVTVPVRSVRGQAQGVVTLLAGYGRSNSGAVAEGIGVNAWALSGDGTTRVTKAEGHAPVLTTQHVFQLDGELDKLFP
ncbi:MAG: molybdopterin dinucleotide binding domain-containing protein, partial [Sphingomonas sp.]